MLDSNVIGQYTKVLCTEDEFQTYLELEQWWFLLVRRTSFQDPTVER